MTPAARQRERGRGRERERERERERQPCTRAMKSTDNICHAELFVPVTPDISLWSCIANLQKNKLSFVGKKKKKDELYFYVMDVDYQPWALIPI